MSRKSNRPKLVSRPVTPVEDGAAVSYWPQEFASLRKTLLIGGAFLCYALLIYGVVAAFDLLWAKRLIAWALGFGNPFDLAAGSMDMIGLLLVFGAVVAGAAVHPVVGLVVLFLVRPWLDGYTYPTDNLYFLWALLGMTGWWALRLFQRGGKVLHVRALGLVAIFLGLAWLTSFTSIQYDNTFRQLLYLAAYAALFLLVTNTANSRVTRGVLLAGLLASMAIQAVYAVLHFEYLLPFMRKMVQDPKLLLHFFGTNTLTPELARRFEVNRAFGSLLFPNALAAFLVLGIPYTIFGTLAAWLRLGPAWRDRVPVEASDVRTLRNALALGACAWFVAFAGLLGALTFIAGYQPEDSQLGALGLFGVAAMGALLPAGGVWWCAKQYGVALCGLVTRAVLLPPLAILLLYTLWITYSRGGLLALLLALLLAAALLWVAPHHWARLGRLVPGRRAVAAGLILGLALSTAWLVLAPASALAQDAAAPAAATPANTGNRIETVTEQGQAVQIGDMTDPESFLLRLTYWQVGLRMYLDNPLLGVGLGNFKVAYPHYQYLGAGHVKEAHNGYLQMFCEMGLLGGLWLLGVVGLFVLWGGRQIVQAGDYPARLCFAGIYAGVIAFLLHAGIDIDLSHPTLVMFLVAFLGLALGLAPRQGTADAGDTVADTAPGTRGATVLGLTTMVLCALVLGMSTRVYAQDLTLSRVSLINVANRQEMMQRLQLGNFLFLDILIPIYEKNRPLHRIPVAELLKLLPDLGAIRAAGDVYCPDLSGKEKYRLLGRGEAVPPDSYLVLLRPGELLVSILVAEKGWVTDVERADARFPHSAELAMYMARWYTLLVNAAAQLNFGVDPRLPHYQERLAVWSAECIRRSPMLADAHLSAADGWWALAKTQTDMEQRATYEKALAAYAQAVTLNTVSGDYNLFYASALKTMGEAEAAAGNAAAAASYLAQSEEQSRLGTTRQKARWQRGL